MSENSVRDYLAWLAQVRRFSPLTVAAYARDLATLKTLAQERDLASLSSHDIRLMTAKLNAQGLNGRSIARALSAWRGYFGWCVTHKLQSANPADGVRAPKAAKLLPKALAVDDALALAAALDD